MGASVPIQVDADDAESGVAQVQIRIDGSPTDCAVDQSFPYECSWNTLVMSNGSHSIDAVITDKAGNTFITNSVSVTVNNLLDTLDPIGTITAPADGVTVSGSGVVVQVEASDNVAVQSVQIQIDGSTTQCPVDQSAPYTCTWNTTLESEGPHTIDAVIIDTSTNSTTTTPITVTVERTETPIAAWEAVAQNAGGSWTNSSWPNRSFRILLDGGFITTTGPMVPADAPRAHVRELHGAAGLLGAAGGAYAEWGG